MVLALDPQQNRSRSVLRGKYQEKRFSTMAIPVLFQLTSNPVIHLIFEQTFHFIEYNLLMLAILTIRLISNSLNDKCISNVLYHRHNITNQIQLCKMLFIFVILQLYIFDNTSNYHKLVSASSKSHQLLSIESRLN